MGAPLGGFWSSEARFPSLWLYPGRPKALNSPRPSNVPLLRALWYLLDGIWGLLKGSWGVLAGMYLKL